MNKIMIIGNLGKDAEVRETANGSKFISFSIADNEFFKGERRTYWYDVMSFNFNEKMLQYYKKGSSLVVTGTLVCDMEVGKDGVARCRRSLTADSIEFSPSSKSEGSSTQQVVAVEQAPQVNMYASQQSHQQEPAPAPKTVQVQATPASGVEVDLPF